MTAALIVIDMLNPYEHEDAGPLMESVADILPSLTTHTIRLSRTYVLALIGPRPSCSRMNARIRFVTSAGSLPPDPTRHAGSPRPQGVADYSRVC